MTVDPSSAPKPGFNFCRVSKTLVALPAWMAIATIVSALVADPLARWIAIGVAIAMSCWMAAWIDRIAWLKRPVGKFARD